MKAAIYARKSTDDNDRNGDNKSVTRQIARARAYAVAKGLIVEEEHIYVADGISGAEFTTGLPCSACSITFAHSTCPRGFEPYASELIRPWAA